MTKLSFVIGEFISGWSHEAWMKIMPCGSLKNERANDTATRLHWLAESALTAAIHRQMVISKTNPAPIKHIKQPIVLRKKV